MIQKKLSMRLEGRLLSLTRRARALITKSLRLNSQLKTVISQSETHTSTSLPKRTAVTSVNTSQSCVLRLLITEIIQTPGEKFRFQSQRLYAVKMTKAPLRRSYSKSNFTDIVKMGITSLWQHLILQSCNLSKQEKF